MILHFLNTMVTLALAIISLACTKAAYDDGSMGFFALSLIFGLIIGTLATFNIIHLFQ